jgi:gliding motility-associated-like protein
LKKALFLFLLLGILTPLFSQIIITNTRELSICDENADGQISIPFQQLQNYALEVLSQFNESPEVYVTQAYTGIVKIKNLYSTNPQIQTVCQSSNGGGFYDIAINSNKEIFIARNAGWLQKVTVNTSGCQYENITQIHNNGQSVLALSFDHLDNLYEGGWTSAVFRANSGDLTNFQLWHDFGEGRAAGDFVQIGNFMYVAWTMPGGVDFLYKVTLGPNNEYISHENLGMIDSGTFGLAAEYGKLYGNTVDYLYEINLDNMQTTVIKSRPNVSNSSNHWWGAAGWHEALNLEISYHREQNQAETGTNPLSDPFTNDANPIDWVYVRVHEATENKTYIIPVQINITTAPTANNANLERCADFESGMATFDLTEAENLINPANVDFTYFETLENLHSNQNQLPLSYSTSTNKTIYVKVSNEAEGCFNIAEINLKLNKLVLDYESVVPFCKGTSAVLSVPNDFVSYQWTGLSGDDLNQNLNSNQVIITNIGNYNLEVKDNDGCDFTIPFQAVLGSGPVITEVENKGECITVKVSPSGMYEYSLDGVFWQSSPTFYNIQVNDYDIHVRDLAGCYSEVYKFTYLQIPNFITPNGDGMNDQWIIRGIQQYANATIQIFDRYGKIFADRKVSANGLIWDGKYLGNPVPSGTYWYIIQLNDEQKLTGHITVKN